MGGLGSGRWEWHGKARTVENCVCISTIRPRDQMTNHIGVIKPTGGNSWVIRCCLDSATNGLFEIIAREGEPPMLRVTLSAVGGGMADGRSHNITFTGAKPHLGGTRWWFVCPLCDRRMSALYLPPNASRFACRLCYGLSYRSSQQSHVVPALISVDAAIRRTQEQLERLVSREQNQDSRPVHRVAGPEPGQPAGQSPTRT